MSTLLFSVDQQIGFITLNRPDKFNAFNHEMALALQDALDECKSNAIRCVYITGAGKAFCSGQDLAEVVDPQGPGMNRILSEHYNPVVMRIRKLEKPVVMAVNGVAAGAGANIALAADVVVAAQSAAFIQAFSKIGLIPDSGGTYMLPRLIGRQKASAIMMLGDKINAEEAERIGLIYKWFADDVFASEALKIASTLASMPTQGLAYTKKALQCSESNTWNEQLECEDKWQQRAALTEDFKEGVAAFIEKRKPVFSGK